MNPRVSRSSALASKATGFPIAKIAAKLAVGFTLDEIRNDITRETPASFEPTHRLRRHEDPALRVREVPGADDTLTTQMKSVGEAMAIGRTLQGEPSRRRCVRSLETGHAWASSTPDLPEGEEGDPKRSAQLVDVPRPGRLDWAVARGAAGAASRPSRSLASTAAWIDPWFLRHIVRSSSSS